MRPDAAIDFLRGLGYSVVSLPKADLKPGQTLLRTSKKELTRLGDLATIVDAGSTQAPQVSADNIAPSGISGKQSSSVDLNIGLNILGNILKALSGTTLGVEAAFKNNKSLTFAYQNVLEDNILLDKLDQYLSSSKFKSNMNMVHEQLTESNVFVIVSTIKSKSVTVQAQAGNDNSGQIDVPLINGIASGSLKVDVSRATEGTVTFTGTAAPVVFGFKAVQIFTNENADYTILKPVQPGGLTLKGAKPPTDDDTNLLDLKGEGVFFDIADERQLAAPRF